MERLNIKRILWIDYAKAFAMFFVIVGHVKYGNYLSNWIYSFHMPLFFLLSGITLKAYRGGWSQYVIKLSKRLMFPYLSYALLYFLYNLMKVIFLHKDINLVNTFLGIFIQIRRTEYTIGLWFLPLLFITEILVYLIVLQKEKIQIIIILLIALIGFFYANIFKQALPWGIDSVPIAMVFVYLGYVYKNKLNLQIFISKRWAMFALFPLLFLSIFWCNCNVAILGRSVDMYEMLYGNPFVYLLAAIHGILVVLLICRVMFGKRELRFWQFVGRNTLHIYCLHGLIIPVLKNGFEIFMRRIEIEDMLVVFQVIIAMMVMLICVILIWGVQVFVKILRLRK